MVVGEAYLGALLALLTVEAARLLRCHRNRVPHGGGPGACTRQPQRPAQLHEDQDGYADL